jgi:hypothetical protein
MPAMNFVAPLGEQVIYLQAPSASLMIAAVIGAAKGG